MMIELTLQKIDSADKNTYILSNIVKESKLIILLGPPGSGKTTLLQNFPKEDHKIHYTSIKIFLKLNQKISDEINLLLLDGLDEYRSTENDKAFVINVLADKLNKLLKSGDINCVISCREMDWYGETDRKALKDSLKINPMVYKIQPLNTQQKQKLAEELKVKDISNFISKFYPLGFLENPQLFTMIADIYKNDNSVIIQSKKALLESFIQLAGEETRESNIINNINVLEKNEIMKHVGYLAMYYIFSNVDSFKDTIKEIACEDKKYPREKLKCILNSKIFTDKSFQHRTLAEFTCAFYLMNYTELPLRRLKTLFTGRSDRIPTELRGTYAWLCSLTGDESLISVDPYYQCVHGDNSHFDVETKKKILTAIKEYSNKNPYFIESWKQLTLEGFYEEGLDDFLIQEIQNSINLKNHYRYFTTNILSDGHGLTTKIKNFSKELIINSNVDRHIKYNLILVFKNNTEILREILDKIISLTIDDPEDSLKDSILYLLYPHAISPREILQYIFHYNSATIGHYYYLYNTEYEDKKELIEKIYQNYNNSNKTPYLSIPGNLQTFIDDFYLETILKYEEIFTAKEIFDIIKSFRKYYHHFHGANYHSYRFDLQNKLKEKDKKIAELTNELFDLYLDEYIENISNNRMYDFSEFFSFRTSDKSSDLILNKISATLNKETNTRLLYWALREKPWTEQDQNKIKAIAKEYDLEEVLDKWLNPPKMEWEKKREEQEKKWSEEDRIIIEKNEEHFKKKSENDIRNSFSDLKLISDLMFMGESFRKKYITSETFEILKNVLSSIIYIKSSVYEYATLESLVKYSPEANRYIDRVYYSALVLNGVIDNEKIKIKDFIKYLYIISVKLKQIINIDHSNYDELIESEHSDFAKSALTEFFHHLIVHYIPEFQNEIFQLLKDNIDLQSLKELNRIHKIAETPYYIENRIIGNILDVFNFKIPLSLLELFSNNSKISDENKDKIFAIITIIRQGKKHFTKKMAISIHSIFNHKQERFESFNENIKVTILDYMMNVFNTIESIEHVNGFQTSLNQCATFLSIGNLPLTDIASIEKLYQFHSSPDDIWRNRILDQINKLKLFEADKAYSFYQVDEIKGLLFEKMILSSADFFEDVFFKLDRLRIETEESRDNEKNDFYNKDDPKHENDCRDVILRLLKKIHGNVLEVTKEKHEAENRVDINVKYKQNMLYEVQIECKRDSNTGIYNAIKQQLINQYLFSDVQYGIYLIFYFGNLRDKTQMLKTVEKNIPVEYHDKIKVICFDLRKKPDRNIGKF